VKIPHAERLNLRISRRRRDFTTGDGFPGAFPCTLSGTLNLEAQLLSQLGDDPHPDLGDTLKIWDLQHHFA
jgi:hypothetical protein